MSRIKSNDIFTRIDPAADSYLEDCTVTTDDIYVYGFRTLPEFRKLLKEHLSDDMTDQEILEAAKTAFRKEPKEEAKEISPKDRDVVDFIYQL